MKNAEFRRWLKDATERVAWTAAQVFLAGVTVEALGLPGWAIGPVTVGLAMAKTAVARKVGDKGSAGTVQL